MAQFSGRMVSEVVQVFWAAMARGEWVTTAAEEVGTYREMGVRSRLSRARNFLRSRLTGAEGASAHVSDA